MYMYLIHGFTIQNMYMNGFFFNLKEITGLGKPKYMKQCGTLTLLCLYRHLENPFRLISA